MATKKKNQPSARQSTAIKKRATLMTTVGRKKESAAAPSPKGWQRLIISIKSRRQALLVRRPHRSFHLTRRRDYHRSLDIPGYWSLTAEVSRLLWRRKGTFLLLTLIYALLTALLVGIASQSTFTSLANSLQQTSSQLINGGFGQFGNATLLFLAAIGGSLSSQSGSASTSIYGILMALLVWLTVVWLLRQQLAGNTVSLRDGLYNAGAPILPTFLIVLVMVVQLLPVGLAAIGYSSAVASGLLSSGVEAMLFWFAVGLLVLLSLFWLTSSFFALIIVTIPGMYPFVALRRAGDLVTGRRIRILLRLLWAALMIAIVWAIVFIPFILLDTWLNDILSWFASVPLIPLLLLVMSSLTLVWLSAYIYGLYRKVVDDVSQPA